MNKSFAVLLKEYIDSADCSTKELSDKSMISESVIKLFLSGKSVPSPADKCSDIVSALSSSLVQIAEEKELKFEKESDIFDCLISSLYETKASLQESDALESNDNSNPDPTSFLAKMDEFNLDEYIKSIHLNDIRISSSPFYKSRKKNYAGLKAMLEGELDFFKEAILSKSTEDVTMCNDMPMEYFVTDPEFSRKWMMGLALLLKKGITVNMIHNLNRPSNELMLGLEAWTPIYMTGLVNPYYLVGNNNIYGHLHYTAGDVAMVGECIKSHHDRGHYYMTRNKEEVAILKEYNGYLLEKALPLMKVYRAENMEEFAEFLPATLNCPKGVLHQYTSLPIFTLDADELLSILIKNDLEEKETFFMLQYHRAVRNSFEKILVNHTITDEVPYIDKDNFEEKKPYLLLTETFCSKQIYYTWDLYEKHLKKTEEFARANPNYKLIRSKKTAYKNIQITVVRGKWALVSKSIHPNIHFVIHHPILRDALEKKLLDSIEQQ